MKQTKIQWCHSTVNPVMGCDGCELWLSPAQIVTKLLVTLNMTMTSGQLATAVPQAVKAVVGDRTTSEIYSDREVIADDLTSLYALDKAGRKALVDVVRSASKCYAGLLGTFRAGHKGYADEFTQPKLFPERMAKACWGAPTDAECAAKPWLHDTPRMVFISDMGDALSKNVPFPYLKQEIIDVATSEAGQRQLWLWLTKRPARMADFGRWLADQGIRWPDNLVAMTTVTSPATAGRVADLRKVPSRYKGLSCEPMFAALNLDLTGIDWCIAGGGSDVLAESFHVEWALGLREQCRKAGTAFFLKQLGKHPVYKGQPLDLVNRHGGDWTEWPEAWRIREIPEGFRLKP